MIEWQYFPKFASIPEKLQAVVSIFATHEAAVGSSKNKLVSNRVLATIREDLEKIGFHVEGGLAGKGKIPVPVLFGRNGKIEKAFKADGFHKETGTVLEVEAGRGVTNYQFLKDLFEACMMQDVNYLCIAVRSLYRKSPDFERVVTFFDTLFASGRLSLPLKGILVVGY